MSDINRFIPFVKWLDLTSRPAITVCVPLYCFLRVKTAHPYPSHILRLTISRYKVSKKRKGKKERKKNEIFVDRVSLLLHSFSLSLTLLNPPTHTHSHTQWTPWDNLFAKGTRKQQETVDKGRRINPLNGAGSSCI